MWPSEAGSPDLAPGWEAGNIHHDNSLLGALGESSLTAAGLRDPATPARAAQAQGSGSSTEHRRAPSAGAPTPVPLQPGPHKKLGNALMRCGRNAVPQLRPRSIWRLGARPRGRELLHPSPAANTRPPSTRAGRPGRAAKSQRHPVREHLYKRDPEIHRWAAEATLSLGHAHVDRRRAAPARAHSGSAWPRAHAQGAEPSCGPWWRVVGGRHAAAAQPCMLAPRHPPHPAGC